MNLSHQNKFMKQETFKKASEITDTIRRLKNQRELLADISNSTSICMTVGIHHTDITYGDFNISTRHKIIDEELAFLDKKIDTLEQEFDNL